MCIVKKPYDNKAQRVEVLVSMILRTQVRHQASDIAKLQQEFLPLLY